ncbi:MAG: TetR-like C-terminal domain-containing protein, partial [Nitriliruptor sp.]
AEWNPELRTTQTELLATGTSGLRRALEAAIGRGELPADHDLDTAIARLAGPLFYRRVLARAPLEDAFVTTIISAYLNEVAASG